MIFTQIPTQASNFISSSPQRNLILRLSCGVSISSTKSSKSVSKLVPLNFKYTFGGLFEDFCTENDFIISDHALLPQDTFTYISDAHNTTSWVDHFVSSFSVHQAMFNMEVLTECIISDHRAVAVSIQCSHLPEFDEEVMEPQPRRIDWLKVTAQEREEYYHESKNLLDQLQLPTEVRHCQNFNSTDEKHLEEIEDLYGELTSALLAAASSAIKATGKENERKFNIPG